MALRWWHTASLLRKLKNAYGVDKDVLREKFIGRAATNFSMFDSMTTQRDQLYQLARNEFAVRRAREHWVWLRKQTTKGHRDASDVRERTRIKSRPI